MKNLESTPTSLHLAINLTILSVLIYLVIFLKLDSYHIRWWDESMFAVNTYEMLQNGKYFSLYYNGMPDLINTKPPLTVWCQLFFVKLLGYNEIAVRLPSALAAGATVFLVFIFALKRFGLYFAWICALLLITSQGFIGYHTARTADSDALLTFFVLAANISFLKFVSEQRKISILYFFIFLTLSFLTKMYAALLFAPAYLMILLRRHLLRSFLQSWQFIAGLLVFMCLCMGVLFLRENETPGYLREIFFKDAGRIFKVVEDHKESWEYYLDNLIFSRYAFWFIPMLLSIYLIVSNRSKTVDAVLSDLILLILSYLLIISLSITKLWWYDMPLYPYMAIVTGYGLFKILAADGAGSSINARRIIAVILIFAFPYWIMFRKSQSNIIPDGEKKKEASESFLFKKSRSQNNLDGVKIYYSGWNGSLIFYRYKFAEKGQQLELTTFPEFSPGERVLISNDSLFREVQVKYKFRLLEAENNARLIVIE